MDAEFERMGRGHFGKKRYDTEAAARKMIEVACGICDGWQARDWWVDAWPRVYIVRICPVCRAVETQHA